MRTLKCFKRNFKLLAIFHNKFYLVFEVQFKVFDNLGNVRPRFYNMIDSLI